MILVLIFLGISLLLLSIKFYGQESRGCHHVPAPRKDTGDEGRSRHDNR